MEYLFYFIAMILIAVGMTGTVIPAVPGLPLIFLGGWLIGWASDYELIGPGSIVILALLALIGVGVDFLAQVLGAKRAGAGRWGLFGAVLGTVAGVFFGVWGIVILPLLGAMAGEVISGRSLVKAGKIGMSTWIGMALGLAVKVALAFTMAGLILYQAVMGIGDWFGFGESEPQSVIEARVPQGPADASPLEGYPGQPEKRVLVSQVPWRPVAPRPAPAVKAEAKAAPAAAEAPAQADSAKDPLGELLAAVPAQGGQEPKAAPAPAAAEPAPAVVPAAEVSKNP